MPSRRRFTYSQRPNHAARSAHARGERLFKTYDTSYIRPKRSKAPAIVAAVLAVVMLAGIAWGLVTLFNGCSGSQVELLAEGQEATVAVADGSGASAIANQLVEARLVSSASEFTNRVNELNASSQLKPGTYTFEGGSSLDSIIAALQAGPAMGNALTVPEGFRLSEIADAVAAATGAASRPRSSRRPRPTRASTPPTTPSWRTRGRTAWRAFCSPKPTKWPTTPPPIRWFA